MIVATVTVTDTETGHNILENKQIEPAYINIEPVNEFYNEKTYFFKFDVTIEDFFAKGE